jgi:hypothetical protein
MARDETAAERMRRYRARLRGEDVPHRQGGRPKKAAAPKLPNTVSEKKRQVGKHVTPPGLELNRNPAFLAFTRPGLEESDPDWNMLVQLWPMKVRDLLELSTKAIVWRMAVMKAARAPHPAPEDYVRCVEEIRAGLGQEYLTSDKADSLLRIVADLDILIPRLTAYREALAPYDEAANRNRNASWGLRDSEEHSKARPRLGGDSSGG